MRQALDFQDHLYGAGYADRTVQEYVKWAKRLARWCDLEGHDMPTLPAHLLRRWVDTTIPHSRESRKQARAACHRLYLMLGRDDEPWIAIRLPRKHRGNPDPLPELQAATFRDAAVMYGGREGLAALGLLYTAARPSEVAEWRWDGIDGVVLTFWRPKNRDNHRVHIHPVLADALERQRPPAPEGYIFAGDRGRAHVTATTIYTWVKRVAGTAGIEGVTPRRLRATAGSKVANVTRDVQAAADLLGHYDLNTTRQFYTVVDDERKAAAMAAMDW